MSVADEITRLNQLREQGALTDAEFEAAKAKALAGSPEPATPGPFAMTSASANQMAMLLHFSQYLGYMIPLLGFAAPILFWQLKKDEIPELDVHGRIVANWLLSSMIYYLISGLLTIILIGFIGLIVLAALSLIYPIVGGIKANDGEPWDYPGSIHFF
ncbi:DUF4870 domain-containing protein [Allorhodopirellula heiligendammensis]|uniref:SHOCT domain-containing protein n=1 Tax=Allorhodopirellula heiligendammensis TaxID=2714739 RepID=A0A5C6BVJ8_9BACT|nr:DUF4870 domain-containing protein [Allorhodopirellula heiligendammensis]TWU16088.1 hypothetical protein Poly21_32930 [Allorhodopirellula heiligendammensis]|tara:strand:+ start:1003 stop:1476 length:474 start_codon:yes stop_codon:yes gene_type:complete